MFGSSKIGIADDDEFSSGLSSLVAALKAPPSKRNSLAGEESMKADAALKELADVMELVRTIEKRDIMEIKSFSSPPKIVAAVFACMLLLFQNGNGDHGWKAVKKILGDPQFTSKLLSTNAERISTNTLRVAETLSEGLDPHAAVKVSRLTFVVCRWCLAVIAVAAALETEASGMAAAKAREEVRQEVARRQALGGGDDGAAGLELYTKTASLREMLLGRQEDGSGGGGSGGVGPDVRLLKASWLAKQGYAKRQELPHRQELEATEPEAFVGEDEVVRLLEETAAVPTASGASGGSMAFPPLLVLSYCWRTPAHPDPSGDLLAILAPVLEWYLSERASLWDGRDAVHGARDHECGVFVDFWSLHQGHRTPPQQEAFARALGRMDEWYGHAATVTLLMTKAPAAWGKLAPGRSYGERGWCTFERAVSSLAKPPAHCLDCGAFAKEAFGGDFASKSREALAAQAEAAPRPQPQKQPQQKGGNDTSTTGADTGGNKGNGNSGDGAGDGDGAVVAGGSASRGDTLTALATGSRPPPYAPGTPFAARLEACSFTCEDDRQVVQGLYDRVAQRALKGTRRFDFSGAGSGGSDGGRWSEGDFARLGVTLKSHATSARSLAMLYMAMGPSSAAAFCHGLIAGSNADSVIAAATPCDGGGSAAAPSGENDEQGAASAAQGRGAEASAVSACLPKLEDWDLWGNTLGGAGAACVVKALRVAGGDGGGGDGAMKGAELPVSPSVPRASIAPHLKSLSLGANSLGDDGVREFCGALVSHLVTLPDKGAPAAPTPPTPTPATPPSTILAPTYTLRLAALNLSCNGLGPFGYGCLGATLASGALPCLEQLFLGGNERAGGKGAAALLLPLCPPPLPPPSDGAQNEQPSYSHLRFSPPPLKHLSLKANGLGDPGFSVVAAVLANPKALPALATLSLGSNGCSDEGRRTVTAAHVEGGRASTLAFSGMHRLFPAASEGSKWV